MPHPAEVHITLIGAVASGPEFTVCGNGSPRAAFRLAVPERRFDRASALWVTSRVGYYTVVCWRTLAEHVGSSLGRGDPVIVTGRQRVVEGSGVEVEATALGHDLRYGLSSFRTVARRRSRVSAAPAIEADPFGAHAGQPAPEAVAEALAEPVMAPECSAAPTKL
jgi:single-strand DNA-binding protein